MFYKNVSLSAKTFHGVTFNPGEVKEVPGYINDRFMIRIVNKPVDDIKPSNIAPQEVKDTSQKKPYSDKSKKSQKTDESKVIAEEQFAKTDESDNGDEQTLE